jgi:hypothetical protein
VKLQFSNSVDLVFDDYLLFLITECSGRDFGVAFVLKSIPSLEVSALWYSHFLQSGILFK